MNPYAFRGWHLPSAYADSGTCDRNYPAMYSTSWTSPYFSTSSVYPFQPDSATSAKQASNTNEWKLQGICSPTPDGGGVNVRENGLVGKSGYEGLLYKPNLTSGAVSARAVAEFEGAAMAREEAQKSCCAISCSCSSTGQGSRLNGMLDTSCGWRPTDMSPALDFNKNPNISPYHQTLCQRGNFISLLVLVLRISIA